MKKVEDLEAIKSIIDSTYNRFGRQLIVNTSKPFDPDNPEMGYCYKYTNDDGTHTQYKIVCAKVGDEFSDYRVLMHEYGHIYLAHLEGIHEDLDKKILKVLEEDRDELIEQINRECGIDFAEALIEKVIDDPVLNHSLHNIAMDMEVNSSVLSLEDVEEMERRITKKLPKYNEEYLKWVKDHCGDNQELKDKIDKDLNRMENETKIKLIHPFRYHFMDSSPFPDDLTYPEYLILIVKHLDQFVKMMVSIKNGGNGDTSDVSAQDVADALGMGGGSGSGNGQGRPDQQAGEMNYSNPNGGGMQGLNDLMESMGMVDPQGQPNNGQSQNQPGNGQGQSGSNGQDPNANGPDSQSPYKGIRKNGAADELMGDKNHPGGSHKDHGTSERDKADRKRELGQITSSGGLGCGSSGGPGATRKVDQMADEVEMALQEVIQNYSSKIIEIKSKKDPTYLYNRGIYRGKLIVPVHRRKYDVKTNPTITFLIDISGSMDTRLVDRILKTISSGMRRIGRGLKYNIITWSTRMGEELKNLDPRKPVPRISMGGGTEMAGGMKYFKENYGKESILVLISDFEDYLEEWHRVEETMDGYDMYGFNYGPEARVNFKWKNFKVRHFKKHYEEGYGRRW